MNVPVSCLIIYLSFICPFYLFIVLLENNVTRGAEWSIYVEVYMHCKHVMKYWLSDPCEKKGERKG